MTREQSRTGGLGTFAGVFTPSILTILGIILFRRTGFVVGGAGLGPALAIILLANVISVLTALSLSAIATNMRVKGGGDYYLISRTLGIEFGGAIGLVLFLAQSVSIAFYCIGFGEAVTQVMPFTHPLLPRLLAAGAVLFLSVFAWLGADWATRLQYVVMGVLGLGLVSFFAGGIGRFDPQLAAANWTAPEGLAFGFLFALFFPAVTGFTQGVSMSGDLKDPGKSLPLGTMLAVGVSLVVYVAAAVLLAGAQTADKLRADYDAMHQIALAAAPISAGVIAACLSSGMASFMGAPRILQAMAEDRILPRIRFFAKGEGSTNNPRRGVALSLAVALITVALGNLNAIAPVVAMFFLTSYGLLNYATYYEARAASPSFRPRFRWFDKHLSLAGALGCLGAMLAIDPVAAVISLSILAAVYQYLKRVDSPARWAHGRRSYNFQRIRELLFEMEQEPPHPRDWRPHILALSHDEHRRVRLLEFAAWVEGNSGLTTVVSIVEGHGPDGERRRREAGEALAKTVEEHDLRAFPLAVTAPDFRTGLEMLLQGYGIGPLKANMILLNWLDQRPEECEEGDQRLYGRSLREAVALGSNILVLDAAPEKWEALRATPAEERRIDVWWGGGATSRLCLLLAYLMTRTDAWGEARLRLLAQGQKNRPERTSRELEEMLGDVRIDAEIRLVERLDIDVLMAESGDAAVTFMPIVLRANRPMDFFGHPVEETLDQLPIVALVLAAEDIALDAEPEEGEAAERAAAADRAEDEADRAEGRERDVDEAS
jgi:amino acid transporter